MNNFGHKAEIIDYLFYKHKDHISTKRSRPFVKLSITKQAKEYLFPIMESLKALPNRAAKIRRETKFETFHQTCTQLSNTQYCSMDQLYAADVNYDVYMVGSDQVWNPYSFTSLEPYFLTFAPKDIRKLAYASSFGVSEIPKDVSDRYRDYLNNLSHISVREKQGVRIVKDLTGRNAQHVLDPTLLLDKNDWGKISVCPQIKTPYILLYVLTESPYITALAKEISSKLGYPIVRICKNAAREDADDSIVNVIDAGPSEFIGLFQNASFVLTNSFHGTAFSVNFNKPIYSVLRANKDNNSRQIDFLESINLKHRILEEGSPLPSLDDYQIDFEEANKLLNNLKHQSLDYLLNAIESEND